MLILKNMSTLTNRQRHILALVIHEYTRVAEPVGSKRLVERFKLDLSSATVRNEMAVLTKEGFLHQPYTSAGRVPTEKGYRYFVRRLMQETTLPESARRTISHQFYQMRNDVRQWMKLAASILANKSCAASLVTAPRSEHMHFKHLELISIHGIQVLGILVLEYGEIRQRILFLDEPISQEQLSITANRIVNLLYGKDAETICNIQGSFSLMERDILNWIAEEMNQSDELISGEIYSDGITNVLSEPEFSSSQEARNALRLLEERSLLQDLLSNTIFSNNCNGVQVLIGGEGNWDELRQVSLILSKYGSPGVATGTIGVLGPIRMAYGPSISVVRFIANILSDLVTEQW